MHIVWIGGGSLGLLFAAKFALANQTSQLIVRTQAQCQAIKHEGLRLIEDDRELSASSSCLTLDSAWTGPEPDWICLMVKQKHLTADFIQEVARLMDHFPKAKLLCFQNGIGHEERLSEQILSERIFTAVTTEAALRIGPNKVEHTGKGEIWIGSIFGHSECTIENACNKLISAFEKAGFIAEMSKNIKSRIWNKLLINAVINPLTALMNIRNGELLATPERIQMMRDVFVEARTVANAEGGEITEQSWNELLEVCRKTASNHSSMLQDVINGRETEVEWINGSIVRTGEKHSLAAPLNRLLTTLIKGLHR